MPLRGVLEADQVAGIAVQAVNVERLDPGNVAGLHVAEQTRVGGALRGLRNVGADSPVRVFDDVALVTVSGR